MKFTGSVVKRSRSVGIPLTPKAARIMERRPNPPGQHGGTAKRRKRSDFGRQLLEKQRLRFQYNIAERQFRRYVERATRMSGNTGLNLIALLERRLDALVLRAGFARTIAAARQLVNHGHFTVNGRRVTIPSIDVKPGDHFAVRSRSRTLTAIHDSLRDARPVPYLHVNKAELMAILLTQPMREDIPVICDINLIVEFYSR